MLSNLLSPAHFFMIFTNVSSQDFFANVKYSNYLQQALCFQTQHFKCVRGEVEALGSKMLLFIFWAKPFFSGNSVTFHVNVPVFIILPLTVFARIIALFYPPTWRMCFHFERNYADFVVPLFCSLQVPSPVAWSMACRHAYQWQMGDGAGVFWDRKRNQVHSGWDEAPVLLNPGATGRGREKQSGLQINMFTWETKMVAPFFLPAVASRLINPSAPFLLYMLLWRITPNTKGRLLYIILYFNVMERL